MRPVTNVVANLQPHSDEGPAGGLFDMLSVK
jgi:hypothetical protein